MACRCTDIDEIKDDLKILGDLSEKAGKLAEHDSTIQKDLTAIADVINDTILVPDNNLHIKIKQQNNTSVAAIEGMVSKIGIKKNELEEELSDAKWEDFWWHFTHPIETIEDWIDG